MGGFHTIRECPGGWTIYEDDTRKTRKSFSTITEARKFAWTAWMVMPFLYVEDSAEFNPDLPLHAALARIEERNTGFKIVLVSPTHYYILRSRTASEQPVRYTHKNDTVTARNDTELVSIMESA